MEPTAKIWMDGELVDWADANVHVATHALHYGSAVFEGQRVYDTAGGPAGFRMTDHFERLLQSGHLIRLAIPYTAQELCRATAELVVANDLNECYVRPIAFFGHEKLGLDPGGNRTRVAIVSWAWPSYFGSRTVRAKISSWRRVDANTVPHVAKASGIYINSLLARYEAQDAGYDEAIMLTDDGYIADGPSTNVFAIKDGVLKTPPLSTSILAGLTRETVMTLARELGHEVREEPMIRTDLYLADEVFVTGTAAEVLRVDVIDGYAIGDCTQPIATAIQDRYTELVHGRLDGHADWVEHLKPLASGA